MRILLLIALAFATLTWMGLTSGLIQFERIDRVKYDRKSAWSVED